MAAKTKGSVKRGATPKNRTAKRARRVAIVEGLVKQQTPKAIASGLGISRKTLYAELKAPETQQLIQRWLEPYHDDVEALIPMAIATVRDGLGPTHRIGKTLLPNDMADRLRAVKVLGTVLGWAQGKTDENGESNPIRKFEGTMEELLIVYRKATAGQRTAQAP